MFIIFHRLVNLLLKQKNEKNMAANETNSNVYYSIRANCLFVFFFVNREKNFFWEGNHQECGGVYVSGPNSRENFYKMVGDRRYKNPDKSHQIHTLDHHHHHSSDTTRQNLHIYTYVYINSTFNLSET